VDALALVSLLLVGIFAKDDSADVLVREDSCSLSPADALAAQMPAIVWGALACVVVAALSTVELFVEDCPVALLFPVISPGWFSLTSDVCGTLPLFFHDK
jgi:hypothetical protein